MDVSQALIYYFMFGNLIHVISHLNYEAGFGVLRLLRVMFIFETKYANSNN